MAKSTPYAEDDSRLPTKLLPQLVTEAMSHDAQEAGYRRMKGGEGRRVVYHPMLSAKPWHGVLISAHPRNTVVKWDDGSTSRAPFLSRLEFEE